MRALRFAAAALLAAISVSTSAQEGLRDRDPNFDATKRIADDLTQASFHYGPFYLLSRFQLSDLGYSEELFVPAATSPSGVSFSVSAPQRLYVIPRKKVVLSVEATPTYAIIHQKGSGNQFGWTARGDAQFLLNHLYLDLYALGFNDLRAANAEIARIVTEHNREQGLKSELKYSSRTSVFFSYAHATLKYPFGSNNFQPSDIPGFDVLLPELDRSENRFRGSLVHKTFPVTSLYVATELNKYKFPNDPGRDARRTYVAPGFNFNNGRTSWKGELGPGKIDFKNAAVRDFSGVLGNTTLEHAFGPRIRTVVGAARDVDFSLYGPNAYYLFDRVQGSADYSVSRKLTLRALSQIGRNSYDSPVSGVIRRDRFTFNALGWMYTARRLRGGFDVGYFTRKSNGPGVAPENGIRVLLHLSFTP